MTIPDSLHKYPESSSDISHCLFSWEMPQEQLAALDRYYLLHWDTSYFRTYHSQLSCIPHKGIDYYTVYSDGHLPKDLFSFREMILSFRRIKGWQSGYVLIRPKYGTEINIS